MGYDVDYSIIDVILTLKLNKNWKPIGECSVAEAISNIAAGNGFYALDIEYEVINGKVNFNNPIKIKPVDWETWINLPIRSWDLAIHSPQKAVRIPTVLIAKNYDKIPVINVGRNPTLEAVRKRDNNIDQYTGLKLNREEMSIDHVIPLSRGGKHDWSNVVLTHKNNNKKKSNKLPHEIGFKLIRKPFKPNPISIDKLIKKARHPDWNLFI